jgi:hypothetical protein
VDYIKIESFCTAEETINGVKIKPTECEKIFANYSSDRGLMSRILRNSKIITKSNSI